VTTTGWEATKAEVNVPVKAARFEEPAYIKWTERPEFGFEKFYIYLYCRTLQKNISSTAFHYCNPLKLPP
jgi:hypothetical protein